MGGQKNGRKKIEWKKFPEVLEKKRKKEILNLCSRYWKNVVKISPEVSGKSRNIFVVEIFEEIFFFGGGEIEEKNSPKFWRKQEKKKKLFKIFDDFKE